MRRKSSLLLGGLAWLLDAWPSLPALAASPAAEAAPSKLCGLTLLALVGIGFFMSL